MIIVEGPDNSGKTTLAGKIMEEWGEALGLEALKSQGPASNYYWWMRILTDSPDVLGSLVCDRFYFGELVYGPLTRGGISLGQQQREVVESMLLTAQPLVIRCKLIRDRALFENRPQTFDWDTVVQAEDYYSRILHSRGPLTVIPYDAFTPGSLERVLVKVASYLDTVPHWITRRSRFNHGRGQMNRPSLMIVGQQFARDNEWKVPFERSRSGQLLHNALRQTKWSMGRIWFTNAYKESNGLNTSNLAVLKDEALTIQPRFILTLGNKATGLWAVVCGQDEECAAIPTAKLFHPGYWLRKNTPVDAMDYYCEALSEIRIAVDQEIYLEGKDK